jgi:hypothetical protein
MENGQLPVIVVVGGGDMLYQQSCSTTCRPCFDLRMVKLSNFESTSPVHPCTRSSIS